MKNSLLWILICIVCLCILMGAGRIILSHLTLMSDSFSNATIILKNDEYISWEEELIKKTPEYKELAIFIDINEKTLEVINLKDKDIIKKYIIASGKKETPSPVGSFKIINKGKWGKSFGTRWMGLNVPWGRYGIHGTDKPNSIGWSVSHGCIRMKNADVEELYSIVKIGTPVTIWGGPFGPFGNDFRILKPGDRGADVYEVQKRMKIIGYYPYYIDGIYGEGMKESVIKFRESNNLPMTHDIDYKFYKELGIELFQ